MKLRKLVLLAALLLLSVQLSSAQESRFTPEYNEHVIKEYIETTPRDGWNIFEFERKFGHEVAVTYLAGMVLMAMAMKHLIKN